MKKSTLSECELNVKPNSRQEWAKAFAKAGLFIIEITEGAKEPVSGNRWLSSAIGNPDIVQKMFERSPNANYGVCPGPQYIWLDLDIGKGKNGEKELAKLELEHGEIETSFRCRTPSGGIHILLRVPHACTNANSFPAGIDVRGGHGYVVGCGSELIEGLCKPTDTPGHYTYLEGSLDDIADAPDWVLDLLKTPGHEDPRHDVPLCEWDQPENIAIAQDFLLNLEPAVQGKGGDSWTVLTAAFLRDFGISEEMALKLLVTTGWNGRCKPRWELEELEVKIRNGYRHSENRPGCKRDKLAEHYRGKGYNYTAALTLDEIKASVNAIAAAPEISIECAERRSFKLRNEAEQDAQPDPEWLIDGVLQRETLALFYGPENSFKSFLVLDLVLSAAAGRSWASYGGKEKTGGYRSERPLTTVYFAGEGAHGIEKLRRPAWRKSRGITAPLPFFTVNEMPYFASESDVEQMIKAIEEAGIAPDIIVIDTAARAMLGLDENSAKDTGIFIAVCDRLKGHFSCAVIVVHHSGKDTTKGARGSTNLPASFDSRFKVTGNTESLVATIQNQKQKDGEPWTKTHTFQGQKVPVRDGRASLAFSRVAPDAAKFNESDPRLVLALEIIAENKGRMPLSMNALAEEMAHCYATEELTDGELEKAKEAMRNFLRKEAMKGLAPYAHKSGKAKNAHWVFEDRLKGE